MLSLLQELWGEVIMESFLTPQPCLHMGEHMFQKNKPQTSAVLLLSLCVFDVFAGPICVLPQTGDMSCQSDKPWKLHAAQSFTLSATLWCSLWEASFSFIPANHEIGAYCNAGKIQVA